MDKTKSLQEGNFVKKKEKKHIDHIEENISDGERVQNF